jgi:GNAT superfamily N-acetyltransferase
MPYCVALPDGYEISDARERLDRGLIWRFLTQDSYWAIGRPRALVDRSLDNSLCFGLYAADGSQVGFGRVVTDLVATAHLDDIFIVPEARSRGLGQALVAAMLGHPDLAGVRSWTLFTRDAHGLYRKFGFGPHPKPEIPMFRLPPQEVPPTP